MDVHKTGLLIAQTRRDLDLTQKELAARLHVSDRAVSKWERGAGFPDVSLLEPLAAELGLSVAELLRGEKGTEQESDVIRDAIRLARQQVWQTLRRNVAAILIVLVFLGIFARATNFWDRILTREESVNCIVTAGLYTAEGEKIGETQVEIEGETSRRIGSGTWRYYGRLAIEGIRETCFEDTYFGISQAEDAYGTYTQEITRYRVGVIDFDTFKQGCYFSPEMRHFAVMTAEGQIIATHDYLAELMALYPNMYHLDNLGHSVYR